MAYIIVSGSLLLALLIIRIAIGRLEVPQDLSVAYAQSIGKRQIQADAFQWVAGKGEALLVVADGIGSGTRGRTAALAASESICRAFELPGIRANPAYFFRQAFHNANEAVLKYVPDGTAGASVLCALIREGILYYALAGNCKASVFRRGELIPLSEGQTLNVLARNAFKNKRIRREDARLVYNERRIYNYVGRDDFNDLEMFDVPVALKKNDYIVLMTAGAYDFCPQLELERILKIKSSCEKKAQAVISLLEKSKDTNLDNATIIIVRVNSV